MSKYCIPSSLYKRVMTKVDTDIEDNRPDTFLTKELLNNAVVDNVDKINKLVKDFDIEFMLKANELDNHNDMDLYVCGNGDINIATGISTLAVAIPVAMFISPLPHTYKSISLW